VFRGLGIASVVDLRSVSEVERTGRGLLTHEPLNFVNSPVLTTLQTDESRVDIDEGYMARRYLEYLKMGAPAFVRVFEEMTNAESYPLVFNCFLGKDRTGVVAALVLSCLGVRRSSIVEDYALTAPRVVLIVEKLLRDPLLRGRSPTTIPCCWAPAKRRCPTFSRRWTNASVVRSPGLSAPGSPARALNAFVISSLMRGKTRISLFVGPVSHARAFGEPKS